MMTEMPRSKGGTLNISPATRDKFGKWCEAQELKLLRGQVAERLLLWFMRQPPAVRTVVLNVVDEGMEQPYADALEYLASALRARKKKLKLAVTEDVPAHAES